MNQFLQAARQAEETLGHPPSVNQIFITLKEDMNVPIENIFEVAGIICSLLREDMVFCDKICYRWTVNKQEGYYSYSELFFMHFGPSYGCDS